MPEAGIFYANESGTAEVQAFVSSLKRRKLFCLFGIIFADRKQEESDHEAYQDF